MAATAPVRRKKRHFRSEATVPPFDIECDQKRDVADDGEVSYRERRDDEEPDVITLKNIQKLPSHSAFELVRIAQTDPEAALKIMVGDQWERFWTIEQWREEPFEATQNLMNEAMEHYSGVTPGNS